MAERDSINQVVQIGVESTAGTAVAANKKFQATSITPGIRAEINTFRPQGGKFSTVAALGKEWSEAGIAGPLTYTEIVYLLSSILNYAAPAQQAATIAYLWTFTPPQAGASTNKTFTVEMGSSVRAHEMKYGMVNSLSIDFTRDEVTVGGSMIGHALSDGITLTSTPTEIALVPVLPTQVSVYIDAAGANLGTTKMTRVLRANLEIGDRFAPVWPIDAANTDFPAHVEDTPTATLKLLMEADSVGMGLLTTMRAGDKKFVRVEGVGALIVSGHYYTFTADTCGVVESVSDFSDEDGVYAIEWTFRVAYDSTWAKAMEIKVKNALTAL